MPKSIYISYQNNRISNANLLTWSLIAGVMVITSTLYSLNIIISDMVSYVFYTAGPLVLIVLMHYHQANAQQRNFVLITEDNILIENQDNEDHLNISLADIECFETRFNEILLHTKQEEVISLKLNPVKCDKKRWEIKQFLKEHIPQTKVVHQYTLAS